MASRYVGEPPPFNKIEDECVYWKARSKFFEDVAQWKLRCAMYRKRANDDQEMVEDPVKKARLEMDPFKVFPQHVYELILNHVNNMDDLAIYRLTKVSRCWNEAVENYKPTAKKLKEMLHLDVDAAEDVAPNLALWMKTNFEIKYKSATVPFNKFGYNCLMKFASSLEEVKLYCSYYANTNVQFDSNLRQQSVFTKLRMLIMCPMSWEIFNQLSNCNFPALNKLKLAFKVESYYEVRQINWFFSKMPKLEQLCMRDSKILFEEFYDKELEAPFRLKSLCIQDCMEYFIQLHADTLENLTIKKFKEHKKMEFIIVNMKKLKFLSLGFSDIQDCNRDYSSDDSGSFIDYNDIEDLNSRYSEEDEDDEYEEYYAKKAKETIQNLSLEIKNDTITTLFIGEDFDELIRYIPALISLETIIVHEELEIKHVKFIALNALKLKRIICDDMQPNLKELFAEFLLNELDNEMINKNIDIIRNASSRYTMNPGNTFCNFKMTYGLYPI